MSIGRIVLTALAAAALAVSACGFKGDPIRPGSDKDPKTQQKSGS
ncbi:MAG TPA: lipoprotein [Thermohalobaculum sp.]|nr:lipoprotein [Thermohalobaculum sp.]